MPKAGRRDTIQYANMLENRPAQTYFTAIPAVTDRPMKRFDVARLKEHRKRLEGIISTEEVDELAMEWLEDSAEVSYLSRPS